MQLKKFSQKNGLYPDSVNYPEVKDNVMYDEEYSTVQYYREPF